MIERVIVVHSDRGHGVDGIRDYSRRFVSALEGEGIEAKLELRSQRGGGENSTTATGSWHGAIAAVEPGSVLFLQYSPFCFARWGFAPWLPARMLSLRAHRRRPIVALMVHEPYVAMDSWRETLMGLWQRLQLRTLRLAADVSYTSIEPWAEMLAAQAPRRPVRHLPVGSNLPDARARREEERQRLGFGAGTVAVAAMGRDHPSWLGEYVVVAANEVARSGAQVALLSLGAEAPRLGGLDPGIAVHAPGYLEPDRLAAMLAAADVFLAPLIDGVSTRRGTMMAALQQALPVVGTSGPLTDPMLRDRPEALRLTPVGEPQRFAAAARQLAEDPRARDSAGRSARRLYEERFDWPVIVRQMLAGLES